MVDEPRIAIPQLAVQTIMATKLLVTCEMMAMCLLTTTRKILPNRTTCTAKTVVVRKKMSTTIPTSIPLRTQLAVRLSIQLRARMKPTKTTTELAIEPIRSKYAALNVPLLPAKTPA